MRWVMMTALVCASALAAPMTKLKFQVTNQNGKPVERAAVIITFLDSRSLKKMGFRGSEHWELRTNQKGEASIPPIPQGKIKLQVIAKGYQTYGEVVDVQEEEKTVPIKLNPPQEQYSAHEPLKP